jgi:hypothetical protein
MPTPPLPDKTIEYAFDLLNRHNGNQSGAAREAKVPRSTFLWWLAEGNRRKLIDTEAARPAEKFPHRRELWIEDGIVLIGSDAHYWPGIISTAHRGFVRACKEFSRDLKAVIMNGDALDGATISRHPPIGWESRPSLIQEIETCQARMGEIEQAAGKAEKIWTLGNHDARFETRLAMQAPEFAKVHGVHLHDHFPYWGTAWSCWINDDVVIKHRLAGGIHAARNNTVKAGKTIITGHTHSAKVTPVTDYNGTRWGVDTGTMAVPFGPQFVDYTEDSPVDWRSAFAVLTFRNGRLLQPELAIVADEKAGEIDFRGKVYTV